MNSHDQLQAICSELSNRTIEETHKSLTALQAEIMRKKESDRFEAHYLLYIDELIKIIQITGLQAEQKKRILSDYTAQNPIQLYNFQNMPPPSAPPLTDMEMSPTTISAQQLNRNVQAPDTFSSTIITPASNSFSGVLPSAPISPVMQQYPAVASPPAVKKTSGWGIAAGILGGIVAGGGLLALGVFTFGLGWIAAGVIAGICASIGAAYGAKHGAEKGPISGFFRGIFGCVAVPVMLASGRGSLDRPEQNTPPQANIQPENMGVNAPISIHGGSQADLVRNHGIPVGTTATLSSDAKSAPEAAKHDATPHHQSTNDHNITPPRPR